MGTETIFNAEAITGAVVVRSAAFELGDGEYFGLWIQASSGSGPPIMEIYYELGYDSNATHFDLPDSESTLLEIGDSKIHQIPFFPLPMPYVKFKAVGGATNPVDTILTLKLVKIK